MKLWELGRDALSTCVVAALLAACGGSQPPIGAPGAMPQSVRTAASSYEVLYRFNGHANGGEPLGRLLDVDGTLYGTASIGGNGYGTVYSISPKGGVNLLFSFSASNGAEPGSGLTDVKGTLYGTTTRGGASMKGTVYSITTAGVEVLLHSFTGHSDGYNPDGRLIDVKGTLYGTTPFGGDTGSECTFYTETGCGVVYSITTSGEEKVLYRFKGGSDGRGPNGLIYINGMLYGTTVPRSQRRMARNCCRIFAARFYPDPRHSRRKRPNQTRQPKMPPARGNGPEASYPEELSQDATAWYVSKP